MISLRGIRNLTSGSIVCEALLRSLFCTPKGLNKLPEVRFKFPFMLIGKLTMAFFNRPIMARTEILYTGGDPAQGFWCCFADRLNQCLVSSVVQATA